MYSCERSVIKIDERGNFQEIFINILSVFIRKKSQERKQVR